MYRYENRIEEIEAFVNNFVGESFKNIDNNDNTKDGEIDGENKENETLLSA